MAVREVFPPKPPSDTKIYTFTFIGDLAEGETITAQSVSASVFSGEDPNPSAIISGAATQSGGIVYQKITAGVPGVIYTIDCSATTSSGQTLSRGAYLAVIQEATQ